MVCGPHTILLQALSGTALQWGDAKGDLDCGGNSDVRGTAAGKMGGMLAAKLLSDRNGLTARYRLDAAIAAMRDWPLSTSWHA